ncbi:hypothetical protein LguiB_024542 [Lonicera macranthoides]
MVSISALGSLLTISVGQSSSSSSSLQWLWHRQIVPSSSTLSITHASSSTLHEDERGHSVYRQPIDRRAVLMSPIGLMAAAIWNVPGDGAAAASEFTDSNF